MAIDHMQIPQVSPWLGEAERAAAERVIASGWITEGPRAAEFGARLNDLIGAPYGVFAPNGTLALYLGLVAAGVGLGDEVIVPDITFIASANAAIMAGATPVFADVDADCYQLDVEACERVVTKRTRAVMPVHLYGMAANMPEVMAFAQRRGLIVVEDAAQALGVRYRGRHAGAFGAVGCFSFFADKTITTGEGGYVACQSEAVYERLRLLRNQGRMDRGSFVHPAIGYNFRITDIQAAIGLAQLAKLDMIIARKLAILAWYHGELDSLPDVRFLPVEPGSEYAPFRVVLLCRAAHRLMDRLAQRGIQPRTFFYPLHRQPCFAHLGTSGGGAQDFDDARFPNAIYGYEHGVALPVFPTLSEREVAYICATIRDFYA